MQTVFHLGSADRAARALSNARNLLGDETVRVDAVAVVANGDGVRALLRRGEYREDVADLGGRVDFLACANSLDRYDLTPDDLADGVDVVSSGVGELTRLQSGGYAYVKP
ncbi:DsrE family protein [Halocalculus aciditolerans]|uniref:DsrE/DsrF-like family protein n=1 Tax=Halocalculus aciditolerans TaxID=1383812 RepID=A0A830F7H5_9EURY|nr:DsrE family protein [Halocalculus aciditolerans]GGL61958.1 hypothetical protein GCM10009039_20220 [Halocalculus aciditolerans]